MTSAKREVAQIGTRIKKLLTLMLDDEIAVDEGKVEMKALDGRRKELEAQLKTADEQPALLHPEMARIYHTKVTALAEALRQPESRLEATEVRRDRTQQRSPETGDLSLQVVMVAGARNRRYLDFCWTAA
jgi:hypothetical protein